MQVWYVYLARIILNKRGAGRDVISGLICINTLGKQSRVEKGKMHAALAALSGSIKATVVLGAGGTTRHTLILTLPKHFFSRAALFLPRLSPTLSAAISCGAGEY